jgi:hypothetical protein
MRTDDDRNPEGNFAVFRKFGSFVESLGRCWAMTEVGQNGLKSSAATSGRDP